MYRSRTVLTIFASLLLVLLLGVTGWCGGPPTAAERGATPPSQGAPPGPAPVGPAQSSPFVSVSGGGAPGSADGSNASSPNINLAALGVRQTWAWTARAMYATDPFEFSVNYFLAQFYGSNIFDQTIFAADGSVLANAGDNVSAYQSLNLLTFNFDIYPFSGGPRYEWLVPVVEAMPAPMIDFGFRLQYTQFADSFSVDNSTEGTSTSGSKGYAMFGIGVAGIINIPLNRMSSWCRRTGIVQPRLNFAASVGTDFGRKARYQSYEAFLQLFRKKMPYLSTCLTGGSVRGGPALSGEVGWVYFEIAETKDEQVGPDQYQRSDAARYSVSFPVFRASLYF
jgi:hypothetical protein